MNEHSIEYFAIKVFDSPEYRQKISPALREFFDKGGVSRIFMKTLTQSDEEIERTFIFLAKKGCKKGLVYSQYVDAFSLYTKLLVKLISNEEAFSSFVLNIYHIYDIINRANSKGYLQELINHDLLQLNINLKHSLSLDYVISHFHWMQKIIVDILEEETAASVELNPKKCVLGQWLHSKDPEQVLTVQEHQEIHHMHNDIHALGESIYEALSKAEYHKVVLDYLMLTRSSLYLVSKLSIIITERDLRLKSQTDTLTSLKNRESLEEELDAIHEKCLLSEKTYAIALLDIDFFKKINDTFGHADGDIVLKEISEIFIKYLPSETSVYRYGGEEFLVILKDYSLDESFLVLELLRKKVEEHRFKLSSASVEITVSIGIAVYKENLTPSQVTKQADVNLYKAKELGRNQTIM